MAINAFVLSYLPFREAAETVEKTESLLSIEIYPQ
jgi:hypothetical protein